MEQVIRWGILGTGQIAQTFAAALADVPGARLAAVGSRSSESAQAFGRAFDIGRCHATYQALADDPQVDVVYIATPHTLHAENALTCLRAGKAVLCEKPFTMNRREAAEVIALARERKLFMMEALLTRHLPAIVEARRLVDAGEIGKVHQVQADFGFAAQFGPEHRVHNLALGGGALLDIGIYPLSMASHFLGPIEEVQASADIGPTGVDLQTAFALRHQGGAISSGTCSLRAHSPIDLTISGELGHVRVHAPFCKAEILTVVLHGKAARTVHLPYLGNGYTHEALEVGRCLRAGLLESPLMPLDETLALMETLDTIRGQIGLRYPADGA